MKIKAKSQNEVVADLVEKVISLEQDMEDLVEVVAKRDEMILGIKKEMSEMHESLLQKIAQRDDMLRAQAEGLKVLAESMKKGVASNGNQSFRKKDIEYLAMLVSQSGYLESGKKKEGIMAKIFGGNRS